MKQKIAQHWEKLALGGSALVMILYVLLGMVMAAPHPILAGAKKAIGGVTDLHEASEKPAMEALTARRRIETEFGPAAESVPGEEWVFYRRPHVEASARLVEVVPVGPEPVFKRPALVSVTADVGAVRMSWDDALGNNIKTSGYHVLRRKKGDKNFEKVTEDPLTDRAYVDGAIQPKTAYEYAVTSIADAKDDKFAEAVKRGLFKDDGVSAPSDPMGVTTVGVIGLALKIVSEQPPANPDEEPVRIARVTVKRFVGGEWMEKDYSVRKGDKIGKPEKVRKDGRPLDVDFTTNYEVLEIAREEVTLKVPKLVKIFDNTGGVRETRTVMEDVKKNLWVLTYKDDEGKRQKVLQEESKPPAPKKAPEKKEGAEK